MGLSGGESPLRGVTREIPWWHQLERRYHAAVVYVSEDGLSDVCRLRALLVSGQLVVKEDMMTFAVWLLGIVAIFVTVAVSYVVSYVVSFRREYSGLRVVGTWTLIKMALRTLVGRGS